MWNQLSKSNPDAMPRISVTFRLFFFCILCVLNVRFMYVINVSGLMVNIYYNNKYIFYLILLNILSLFDITVFRRIGDG